MSQTKQVISFIILVVFLLSLSITLTIHAKWLYWYDLNHSGVLEQVGYTSSTVMKNYDQLLDYFNYPWIKFLKMSDFPTSNSGAFHMFQVKILFQVNYIILFLSGIFSLFYIRYLTKEACFWTLLPKFKYLLLGLGVGLFFVLVAFNEIFTLFHKVLFFGNDDWMFNPMKDPIILVLPETFFFHCFILFFTLFILFIAIFMMLGQREFRQIKRGQP